MAQELFDGYYIDSCSNEKGAEGVAYVVEAAVGDSRLFSHFVPDFCDYVGMAAFQGENILAGRVQLPEYVKQFIVDGDESLFP